MNPGPKSKCVLLGGGGHAGVLLEIIRLQPACHVVGILDANRQLWNKTVHGALVLGGDDLLPSMRGQGTTHFALGVGSTSSTERRRQLFQSATECGLIPLDVIHPTAWVSPSATVGPGCQLLPHAAINTGARLGRNVLVNTGAIIEHDCHLDDHIHVASGAILCGHVTVGIGTHVGAGAVIRQCIRVGRHALVGAGAVVVDDVPDQTAVVGVPARARPGLTTVHE